MGFGSSKRLPKSYSEAENVLGSRESRKVANNTRLEKRAGNAIALQLHGTDILTFYANGDRILNSGGWKTVTTKARLRDAGVDLCQAGGDWSIGDWRGETGTPYADGMILHPDGTVTGAGTLEARNAARKLRQKVSAFAKGFAAALVAGELELPSAGDCLYCQMRDVKTGKPIPHAGHLLSHLEESYFVPSLLFNALDSAKAGLAWHNGALALMRSGLTQAEARTALYSGWNVTRYNPASVARFIRRYILAELQKGGAL